MLSIHFLCKGYTAKTFLNLENLETVPQNKPFIFWYNLVSLKIFHQKCMKKNVYMHEQKVIQLSKYYYANFAYVFLHFCIEIQNI